MFKKALVALLVENKLENISIIALTDKAQINRKTFYLHYKDVSSIYKEITSNLTDKIVNQLNSTNVEYLFDEKTIYSVLSIISCDEFAVAILKETIYARRIIASIETVIIDNIFNKYLSSQSNNNNHELRLIIEFNVYGSMNVFLNWIRGKSNMNLFDLSSSIAEFTYKPKHDD